MNYIPAIETFDLEIGYLLKGKKKKLVNEGLQLSLKPGEVTCLLGLNGAGKSTLLRTLCGFQKPLGGSIHLQGKPLTDYSQRLFSLTVGVVLTEKTNAGGITVYELVSLGRHPYTGFFGQLKKKDHEIIRQSLEAAGISHKAKNYVSELSDGERQKAMIAKALAQQCPLILLDEPTAFLDVTSRIETMVLLRKLAREQHKAILLSTHDLDLAIQMGDGVSRHRGFFPEKHDGAQRSRLWIVDERVVVHQRNSPIGFIVGQLTAQGGVQWRVLLGRQRLLQLVGGGFFGGLIMSAIKRDRGVKDWGTLVQGHGGILDRLDSLVFSAPVFLHILAWGWL